MRSVSSAYADAVSVSDEEEKSGELGGRRSLIEKGVDGKKNAAAMEFTRKRGQNSV